LSTATNQSLPKVQQLMAGRLCDAHWMDTENLANIKAAIPAAVSPSNAPPISPPPLKLNDSPDWSALSECCNQIKDSSPIGKKKHFYLKWIQPKYRKQSRI